MASEPGGKHQRLEALVGRWKTEGWTRDAPGAPAARIDARAEGAEIIGYDPARGA